MTEKTAPAGLALGLGVKVTRPAALSFLTPELGIEGRRGDDLITRSPMTRPAPRPWPRFSCWAASASPSKAKPLVRIQGTRGSDSSTLQTLRLVLR
jgi:hypothetical protein